MIDRKFTCFMASLLMLPFLAQSISATTIRPVKISDLFAEADLVAIVRIVAGDSEHYLKTVYKAEVIAAFKGATSGETIFFGPYVSLGVGSEYLVFMVRTKSIAPIKNSEGVNYGAIPIYYQIMYEGYSVMPVGYECVFDGKETNERCDYSIQLNPSQIILPGSIRTFPRKPADAITNYKKWIRRNEMIALVEGLGRYRSKSAEPAGRSLH
jgi:hypothetical protein